MVYQIGVPVVSWRGSVASDRKYLEWHGTKWRVRVKVTVKARPIIGKAHLVRPLGTDSLAVANLRKHKVVGELMEQIARAEAEAVRRARRGVDPRMEEAFEWRSAVSNDDSDEGTVVGVLYDRVDELVGQIGAARAHYFARVAQGLATPLDTLTATWLAEASYTPRTSIEYDGAVRELTSWLAEQGLSGDLEGVSRVVAGRYVSALIASQISAKTVRKKCSALASYWRWMIKKGHASDNAWLGQAPPKVKRRSRDDRAKRPYEDHEVSKLFQGITKQPVRDAMAIAALSGMRVEEIAQLRVSDCSKGFFNIRASKTEAGIRAVPIHSSLTSIVEARLRGKAAADYLLHELREPKPGRERGDKITRAFTRLRRKVGVDEVVAGSRQSRIDFHSFRRWFSTKARDALNDGAQGYRENTISEVMGHDVGNNSPRGIGMTLGVYAGPNTDRAKIACVEAVRLPEGCMP